VLLNRVAYSADRVISKISRWLHSVGVSILAAMMLLTFADVALRYVFNRPISGSYELTEFMMAVLLTFGIAYCAVVKGHVTVDVVVSRFPQRVQAIIDSITCLLGLSLFSLITWQCILYAAEKYGSGHGSVVLEIPIYPFIGLIALGSLVFCLALLAHLIEFLSQAVEK